MSAFSRRRFLKGLFIAPFAVKGIASALASEPAKSRYYVGMDLAKWSDADHPVHTTHFTLCTGDGQALSNVSHARIVKYLGDKWGVAM